MEKKFDRISFEKLSDAKRSLMLFDLLISLVGNVDVMCGDIKMLDVNGDTLQKKLDVTSKEIKLAVKHATDRVDKVME